jgi:transcriptional regulator GlxA family with amidase domain
MMRPSASTSESSAIVLELRRAWLKKDLTAMVHELTALAPQCHYASQALARTLDITPRQLQRVFAVSVGRTPQEWLNEQRLLAARDMLSSARTVKEVAYALGFSSASRFSRAFKKRFGVAPSTVLVEESRERRHHIGRQSVPFASARAGERG